MNDAYSLSIAVRMSRGLITRFFMLITACVTPQIDVSGGRHAVETGTAVGIHRLDVAGSVGAVTA